MRSHVARVVGGLAWLLVAGCALVPPRVGAPAPVLPDPKAQEAYREVLARYTAHRELYAVFDTRMLAAATHQGWPFREARARHVAAFQVQPPELLARRLAEEKAEADAYHDFFFAAHVSDYRFDDFDREGSSIWRIVLTSDAGGEVTPLSVERIGRCALDLRALYPYCDDFWNAYRIRFPRALEGGAPVVPAEARRMVLRLASTLGKMELTFPAPSRAGDPPGAPAGPLRAAGPRSQAR